ncbi:helix-turn-helix domain-containing protein [Aquabacterium sp. A7-Y]|uniref:helix-turn-helix domain-containing protein n=1 Tax=Aquabacterium sp. A7-Y TaxID=1349605 RepID=UPI00223E3511|nr:helix-turn-helix transcriptional regulator [Aquabacterium sp. A7-Y]MCW7538426.1 helix-turn-helix domain-containing protein [Aquabacterium sp. A7-Y]
MDCPEAFGVVVRELRLQRGLTQNDLALRSGLHFNQISRLERATSVPSLVTVFAIADALEVRPDALVTRVMEKITAGRRTSKF